MNIKSISNFFRVGVLATVTLTAPLCVSAQEVLPNDNGLFTYHSAPRYRESESHPLRIVAYVFHPIGWVLREAIFRPISYFASSTETTRSVMGYREPYDYRQPECFSADDSVPDCRSIVPFNYDQGNSRSLGAGDERAVYFPDVNFDFNSRKLNTLGTAKAHSVAQLLKSGRGVKVVLQGHTDFKGSDEYNMKLGMDRAEAVRKELVVSGIPADRLSTVTFGESQPLFAEKEDWARAANRRVETKVEDSVPSAPAPMLDASAPDGGDLKSAR